MKRLAAAGAICLLGLVAAASGQPPRTSGHWVSTWTTASVARLYPPPEPAPPAGGAQTPAAARAVPLPNNQTLRQIVRASIGGDRVRVVLTNAFGTAPLVVGAAHIALREKESATLDANLRWPDQLARRLPRTAIVNAGIGGNRLLSEGIAEFGINILARFERDVLLQPGVTHVIVMEGINDIGNARENPAPSAGDLVAAQQQLIERAHARGLKIFGATLTPIEGAAYATRTRRLSSASVFRKSQPSRWTPTGRRH